MSELPDVEELSLAEAAQAWASAGFLVLPCDPKNKRPHNILSKKPKGEGGYMSASSDPDLISEWWLRAPDALVGVVPGSGNAVVIDVDGEDGRRVFWEEAASRGFDLHATPIVETPGKGGGQHVWFDRSHIEGTASNRGIPGIGEQRGDNGYVIVPPSPHPDGGFYTFNETRELAAVPEWAGSLLSFNGSNRADTSDITRDDIQAWIAEHSRDTDSTSGERAILQALGALSDAAKGHRHPTLASALGAFLNQVQQPRTDVDLQAALDRICRVFVSRYAKEESQLRDPAAEFWALADDLIRTRIAEGPPEPTQADQWKPEDLSAVGANGLDPIRPSVLYRRDGKALLYPGKLNVVFGAPEAGKSWVAILAVAELVRESPNPGIVAVYLDYEDDAQTFLRRLWAAGVHFEDAAKHVRYYSVASSIRSAPGDLEGIREAELVVIDTTNSAMTIDGLDPVSNADALTFINHVRWLRRGREAAWLLLDHEPISTTNGRRQAIGAQSKLGAVDGAQYRAIAVEQPRPGSKGAIALYLTKDRAGSVRSSAAPPNEHGIQHAATVRMDPRIADPERFEWVVLEPQGVGDADLKEAILQVATEWRSKSQIRDLDRAGPGLKRKNNRIDDAEADQAGEKRLVAMPRSNYVVYKSAATDALDAGEHRDLPPPENRGEEGRPSSESDGTSSTATDSASPPDGGGQEQATNADPRPSPPL